MKMIYEVPQLRFVARKSKLLGKTNMFILLHFELN